MKNNKIIKKNLIIINSFKKNYIHQSLLQKARKTNYLIYKNNFEC